MYGVEQSTTMPYNPCGNAPTERLNRTLIGLLKSLPKEQKCNRPLHLPLLVFAYNAMPHDTTGYQPYELMFGHKAPTICDAWLRMADYYDNFSQSKCAWVNQHHELILAANRWALKRIKTSAENQSLRQEEKLLKFHYVIWCYCITIQKVKIRSWITTKVNCLSWNQSTRTQMLISSNH